LGFYHHPSVTWFDCVTRSWQGSQGKKGHKGKWFENHPFTPTGLPYLARAERGSESQCRG